MAVRITAMLVLFGLLGAVYVVLIRPAQLRWGATAEEIARAMPEDGIVLQPVFDATRAITIHGRPEDVWPWLAQMGYRQAGFYGYDLIENLGSDKGIRSARAILPAFQHPQTGDLLPISAAASVIYGSIVPGRYLVWRDAKEPPNGVFIWALVPVDGGRTRLVSRIRLHYHTGGLPLALALGLFTEFADHVAVPRILVGVRDRVEGRAPESLTAEAVEIGAWLLAFIEFWVGVAFILCSRQWGTAWLLALGAGGLLQFVLYAHAPVWICGPLPWLYLALIVWRRSTRVMHLSEDRC